MLWTKAGLARHCIEKGHGVANVVEGEQQN